MPRQAAPVLPTPGRRVPPWALSLGLVAIGLAAHGRSVTNGFIWDDDYYVIHNGALRTLAGLRAIWADPSATPQYYPLVHTTYWLEYHVWGLAAAGYHAVNVLLHAGSTLLVHKVFRRLGLATAGLAAALFAAHPLGVESVGWVTERKNTLSMVFALAALLAWLEYRFPSRERAVGWLVAAVALFTLGLLSKTVVSMLVPTLLIVTWWKTGKLTRRDLIAIAPFMLIGVPLAATTVWLEKANVFTDGPGLGLTVLDRVLIAGRAVWFYAAKLVWPHPLAFFYTRWDVDPRQLWQWVYPAAGLVAAGVAIWLAGRRGRGWLAGPACFCAALFPALGFVDVYPFRYSFVADHFAYHAMPAGLAALAAGLHAIAARLRQPALGPAVAIVLAGMSWSRTAVFKDLDTLYTDTLAKNPTCSAAANNLGFLRLNEGRTDEAIELLIRSADTAPFADMRSRPLVTLARAYLKRDDHEQAYQAARAGRAADDSPLARSVLAIACVRTGRLDEADAIIAALPAEEARSTSVRLTRGELALRRREPSLAATHFRAAIDDAAADTRSEAATEAIVVYATTGHVEEAVALLGTLALPPPVAARGWRNVGIAHAQAGAFAEAVACFEKALGYDPASGEISGLLDRARAAAAGASEAPAAVP
jgi:protein O-mannosyl-transferase